MIIYDDVSFFIERDLIWAEVQYKMNEKIPLPP